MNITGIRLDLIVSNLHGETDVSYYPDTDEFIWKNKASGEMEKEMRKQFENDFRNKYQNGQNTII